MSDKEKRVGEVHLTNVLLSFEHLFTPTASVDDGPKKYKANFLIDPESVSGKKNIKAIRKAIAEVEEETFGKTGLEYKEGRCSFIEGEKCISQKTDEPYEGYEGMWVVKASNPKRPSVFDRDGETPLAEDDDKIFSGCIVNTIVRFWGTKDKKKGGKGLFCTLEGVQYVKEGERFGGGSKVKAGTFANLGDDEDEDDEDEDLKKKKSKKSRDDDEDDEDDEPKSKKKSKKSRDDDDDEDDEDDEPKSKKKSKKSRDDDDEDEDEDDEPKSKKKKKKRDDDDDLDDEEI